MTSYQISEWEAYDRIDPIGTWRDDFRMAFIASVITNCFIGAYGKKGAKGTTPEDFMPDWTGDGKEPKQQTVEEMEKILLSIAGSQNKKVEREKGIHPPKDIKKLRDG